ncbi:hypothetical protein, partial [Paraburkholderia sp. SIMBA_053]|uniref:hypothetical protein n=1 Tax=Paraburkholderia sp. SIMBA_053 TaxID=3085794 RepID=UPI00397CEFCA
MIKKLTSTFIAFASMLIFCSFEAVGLSDIKKQQDNIERKILYNKKKHTITLSWSEFGGSGNYIITRGGSRLASGYLQIGSTSKLT